MHTYTRMRARASTFVTNYVHKYIHTYICILPNPSRHFAAVHYSYAHYLHCGIFFITVGHPIDTE